MGRAPLQVAKHNIDDFSTVLYREIWTVRHMNGEYQDNQAAINMLLSEGLIEVIGRTRYRETDDWFPEFEENEKPQQVYRWIDGKQQGKLQQYYEDRNELPECGHRPHVPAERNDRGEYLCKFCGTPYDRETIQEAL